MSSLMIRLFGRFEIQRDDQIVNDLNTRKVQELLAYLLLYRDHLHRRETLANLLWENSTTTQSLKYLRQALWQLHTVLECAGKAEVNILLVDPEWVGLNSEADLWFDVAEFEQAFMETQGIRGQKLEATSTHMLQRAVQFYRGNLLEGWYQDWCLYERERLQNLYLAMLDKLMGYCEVHQEYEAGVVYGLCALRYDRARERTHRRLMRLYYLAGNRTAALRQYKSCATALREELDVTPARSTVELYQQIRMDQYACPTEVLPEANRPALALLSEVVGHLKQFKVLLNDTQRQVEQNIQAVEHVLNEKQ